MFSKYLSPLKISELNSMQLQAIDAADKKGDVVILSPTGSGKTLAFLLPVVFKLKKDISATQALIVVPTRELALQIEQVFKGMSTGFKVLTFYGGHSFSMERQSSVPPPAVIIGTPGRIADHMRRETLDFSSVKTIVLDEFDKSLELGFKNEMEDIIAALRSADKKILTSATELKEFPSYLQLRDVQTINVLSASPVAGLKQKYISSKGKDKLEILFKLLCKIGDRRSLVFCNHREAVNRVSELLFSYKIPHAIFHGGLEQEEREKALIGLRNGSQKILLTTDLASRGLDIPEVEFVIHYQLPPTEQVFVHRNGRTARMHAEGTSYVLLSSEEYLPPFVEASSPEREELKGEYSLPPKPEWTTIYIAAGKKDKVNKVDVVGFLSQKGKLEKNEVGLIEVKDHACYVAVNSAKVRQLLELISNEKIKNKKVKVGIAYPR